MLDYFSALSKYQDERIGYVRIWYRAILSTRDTPGPERLRSQTGVGKRQRQRESERARTVEYNREKQRARETSKRPHIDHDDMQKLISS